MTPEISSVAGLRSGIAAFMRGDSFSHGRSALRDPSRDRFAGDLAARRVSGTLLVKSPAAGVQFTVAPQHRLYFFPEPHGHASFRPVLEALLRGTLVWALTCRCDRKYW